MIKSLTILTAALAAGLLASEASARLGLSFNGRNLNGVSENGRNLNGIALEGKAADRGVQATTVILKDGSRVTLQ